MKSVSEETAQKKIEKEGEHGTLVIFISKEQSELLKDGNKEKSVSPGQSLQSPGSPTQHPLGVYWY